MRRFSARVTGLDRRAEVSGIGALDVPLGQEANRQSQEEDEEEGDHVIKISMPDSFFAFLCGCYPHGLSSA